MISRIGVFAAVYIFCAHAGAVRASCGVVDSLGEPLGGGEGYIRTIAEGDINLDADADLESLINALDSSKNGEVIFIDGEAEIDFGNTRDVTIPAGVTLASDRGAHGSRGARLYTSDFGGTLIATDGDSVRITGLRLEGPSQTKEDLESTVGITSAHDDLEVDNCELYGFTFAPVAVEGNALISHNSIHHNQHSRLGYGVVLDGSDPQMVEIFGNVFNANRHAVAGTGQQGQSYVVHNNLVLWAASGHVFGMHAECEPDQPVYGSPWAGDFIEIHNNHVLTSSEAAVTIGGSLSVGANIANNYFNKKNDAIEVHRHARQSSWPNGEHEGDPYCLEVQDEPLLNYDWESPSYNCYETSLWLIGLGGTDHYQILNDDSAFVSKYLKFGDFDGDGASDVFVSSKGSWHISWGGRSTWDRVNSFNASVESLRLGDFDGDGKTDVFQKIGSNWRVSWKAQSKWERIGSSSVPLEDLRFEDFNGDGRTDILNLSGNSWKVSYSQGSQQGMTTWQVVRNFPSSSLGAAEGGRGRDINELRFGDFDGDGATDVFSTDGGMWWVSYGAKDCDILVGCHFSEWDNINTSPFSVESIGLADIDGDGKTDVLHISNGRFRAAYGGRGNWHWRGEAPPVEINTLVFKDFTGDGKDDVFYSFQDD